MTGMIPERIAGQRTPRVAVTRDRGAAAALALLRRCRGGDGETPGCQEVEGGADRKPGSA